MMVNCEDGPGGSLSIKRVQIIDLEDSFALGPRGYLMNGRFGNEFWRSPESWALGLQTTSSDVFSFGITVRILVLRLLARDSSDFDMVHSLSMSCSTG